METIADRSFTDETIDADGKEFLRCTFERTVLRFHGRQVFHAVECRFTGCSLELADSANVVMQQFRTFLGHGGAFADAAKHFLYGPDVGPSAHLH